jgi:hypothetical protein
MKPAPIPCARRTKTGDESTVSPGFTLGRYHGQNGEPKIGWRCGHIMQDPVHGEWRRRPKYYAKSDGLKH